jgi:hypothetical protein
VGKHTKMTVKCPRIAQCGLQVYSVLPQLRKRGIFSARALGYEDDDHCVYMSDLQS